MRKGINAELERKARKKKEQKSKGNDVCFWFVESLLLRQVSRAKYIGWPEMHFVNGRPFDQSCLGEIAMPFSQDHMDNERNTRLKSKDSGPVRTNKP